METLVNQLEGSLLVLSVLFAISIYVVRDELRKSKKHVDSLFKWADQAYARIEWLTELAKDHDTQLHDHEDQLQGLEEHVGGVDEVTEDGVEEIPPLTYAGWKQAEEERKRRMKEGNHDV